MTAKIKLPTKPGEIGFIPFSALGMVESKPKAAVRKAVTPIYKGEVVDEAAKAINHAYDMSVRRAEEAVEYASDCGRLLLEQKAKLAHGEFMPWVEKHCKFKYSTAARYMKVAAASRNLYGVELSALSHLFPSGRPLAKTPTTTAAPKVTIAETTNRPNTPKTPLPVVAGTPPIDSPRASPEADFPAEAEKPAIPDRDALWERADRAHAKWHECDATARALHLETIKAGIAEYAEHYGWGAAAMDLVEWLEAKLP